ncbi:MAG: hypothetical protein KBC28_07920, partial [Alphaproteobacteria bacterium]|nr:hypothetical protein [Alphaproteobacteria bacterium]
MIKKFTFALGVTSILGDSQSAYALVSKNKSFEDEHFSSTRSQSAPTKKINGESLPWTNPSPKFPEMKERSPFSEQVKKDITHIGSIFHRVLVFPTNKEMQRSLRLKKKSMREELRRKKKSSIKAAITQRKRARLEARSAKKLARMLRKKRKEVVLKEKRNQKIAARKLTKIKRLKLRKNKKSSFSLFSRKRFGRFEGITQQRKILALKKRLSTHLAQPVFDRQLPSVKQGGKPIQPLHVSIIQSPVKENFARVRLGAKKQPMVTSRQVQPQLSKKSVVSIKSVTKAKPTLASVISLHPVSGINKGILPETKQNMNREIIGKTSRVQAKKLRPASLATLKQVGINLENIPRGSLFEPSLVQQKILAKALRPASPQASLTSAAVVEETTLAQVLHVKPVTQLFDEAVKWVESQVGGSVEVHKNERVLEGEPSVLQSLSIGQVATHQPVEEKNKEEIRQGARPSKLAKKSPLRVDSPIEKKATPLDPRNEEVQGESRSIELAKPQVVVNSSGAEDATPLDPRSGEVQGESRSIELAKPQVVVNSSGAEDATPLDPRNEEVQGESRSIELAKPQVVVISSGAEDATPLDPRSGDVQAEGRSIELAKPQVVVISSGAEDATPLDPRNEEVQGESRSIELAKPQVVVNSSGAEDATPLDPRSGEV